MSARIIKTEITVDAGPYTSLTVKFESHKFEGQPLADTNVKLEIPVFSIHYDDRQKFANEIAEIVKKFQI